MAYCQNLKKRHTGKAVFAMHVDAAADRGLDL
jgi:hypothetical protein